jgi:hypothetical protein
MKPLIIFLTLIVYLSQASFATADLAFLKITPSKTQSLNWDLNANGMLSIRYDLDGNTQADLYTILTVKRSFFSKTLLENEYKNWADSLVFSVNYQSFSHYYITEKNPLFYAIDLDGDGHWDLMYKDVLEDGLNGNEDFYDSPSGMFEANKEKFLLKNVLPGMYDSRKAKRTPCELAR